MIKFILSIVRPPGIRPTSTELKDAQEVILSLGSTLMHAHMRLITHFLQNTAYDREYYETAEKRRRSKLKLPELDVDRIVEVLDLPKPVLKAIWYPLAAVVPSAPWEPIETAASDNEEWDSNTPTIAVFYGISAEIVAKTSRVWSATQQELSTHIQVAVLKDVLATLFSCKWPQFVVTNKQLRFFQKGAYTPENIDAFFDKVFKPPAKSVSDDEDSDTPTPTSTRDSDTAIASQQPDTMTATASQDSETLAGQDSTTTEIRQTAELKLSQSDLETNMDAVIQSQISEALVSAEVVNLPMIFGSEFTETDGFGLSQKSMTEIMDLNERS
jgi:hypothetical protein